MILTRTTTSHFPVTGICVAPKAFLADYLSTTPESVFPPEAHDQTTWLSLLAHVSGTCAGGVSWSMVGPKTIQLAS